MAAPRTTIGRPLSRPDLGLFFPTSQLAAALDRGLQVGAEYAVYTWIFYSMREGSRTTIIQLHMVRIKAGMFEWQQDGLATLASNGGGNLL